MHPPTLRESLQGPLHTLRACDLQGQIDAGVIRIALVATLTALDLHSRCGRYRQRFRQLSARGKQTELCGAATPGEVWGQEVCAAGDGGSPCTFAYSNRVQLASRHSA